MTWTAQRRDITRWQTTFKTPDIQHIKGSSKTLPESSNSCESTVDSGRCWNNDLPRISCAVHSLSSSVRKIKSFLQKYRYEWVIRSKNTQWIMAWKKSYTGEQETSSQRVKDQTHQSQLPWCSATELHVDDRRDPVPKQNPTVKAAATMWDPLPMCSNPRYPFAQCQCAILCYSMVHSWTSSDLLPCYSKMQQ
jgi:hypothetical protein